MSAAAVSPPTERSALRAVGASGAGVLTFSPAATDPLPVGNISTYWLTADAPGLGGLFAALAHPADAPATTTRNRNVESGPRQRWLLVCCMSFRPPRVG